MSHHDDDHRHDLGLLHDLEMMGIDPGAPLPSPARPSLGRRRALQVIAGGAGALALAACGKGGSSSSASSTSTTVGSSPATSGAPVASGNVTSEIPDETGGPFPGDGSNGPNVLTESGVVRSDIRSSFGSYSGTAGGVPLEILLELVHAGTGAAYGGAAVYLWHCDREGRYSLYSQGATDQNYLRGVQEADGNGDLAFTTVFPGAYGGRYPHIHFEVFSSLSGATSASGKVKTSQLALPTAACDTVYATSGYSQSKTSFPQTPIDRDSIFRDGYSLQMATVTGDASGMTATLTVAV
jgi:protocatechuate 3,4-dioxygenase beta subunit